MLRINKEVEYAVLALKAVSEENRIFSSREIADKFGFPCELLRKVLQRLAMAGLIGTMQGKKGGYYGIKPLSDISLGDVSDAILDRTGLVQCQDDTGACPQENLCTIRENMSSFQGLWNGFLHRISVLEFTENRHGGWDLSVTDRRAENSGVQP